MTPEEFSAEINRIKTVLPAFAAGTKLTDDGGEMLPGQPKNAVARFWFSKVSHFPVEAFRQGYEKAALQPQVFPNFSDVLKFTKEAISEKAIEAKSEALYLPSGNTQEYRKYYDNGVYIQPRASEDEREDKIDEQVQLLTRLGFRIDKITRHQGVFSKELKDEYPNVQVDVGNQAFTAVMIFNGRSDADWDALGKAHRMDYSWTREHARVRELEGSDPGNKIADAFARMHALQAEMVEEFRRGRE